MLYLVIFLKSMVKRNCFQVKQNQIEKASNTHPNVNFVKRNRLQDCQLASLDVQGEVVDGRVLESHQDRVERNATHVDLKKTAALERTMFEQNFRIKLRSIKSHLVKRRPIKRKILLDYVSNKCLYNKKCY